MYVNVRVCVCVTQYCMRASSTCRPAAWCVLLGVLACAASPVGVFWLAARRCSWPTAPLNFSGAPPPLHALVIADAHILGRRRTLLDRTWTDWGLASGFVAAVAHFRPDVVLNLGDVVDEVTGGETYSAELARAHRIFLRRGSSGDGNALVMQPSANFGDSLISAPNTPKAQTIPYFAVVGNHDAKSGFHYLHDALVHRFSGAHGFSTGVFSVKNVTFARIDSMALHPSANSKQSRQRRQVEDLFRQEQHRRARRNVTLSGEPIGIDVLLTHMPLYRKDDLHCGEERNRDPPAGGVTFYPRSQQLVEHDDCMGQDESRRVLAALLPRNVLSGHLHVACRLEHPGSVFEVQVPSFGWRMRPDAGYALVKVRPGERMHVEFCALPNEHTLIAVMMGSAIGALALVLEMLAKRVGMTLCCRRRVKDA